MRMQFPNWVNSVVQQEVKWLCTKEVFLQELSGNSDLSKRIFEIITKLNPTEIQWMLFIRSVYFACRTESPKKKQDYAKLRGQISKKAGELAALLKSDHVRFNIVEFPATAIDQQGIKVLTGNIGGMKVMLDTDQDVPGFEMESLYPSAPSPMWIALEKIVSDIKEWSPIVEQTSFAAAPHSDNESAAFARTLCWWLLKAFKNSKKLHLAIAKVTNLRFSKDHGGIDFEKRTLKVLARSFKIEKQ